MGKIVVIGSSNTDMVISAAKMPKVGETLMGGNFAVIQGGKGANQAVAAARANSEVIFIAKVGNDDFGRSAIQGYKKDKIITDYIYTDPTFPTGVAVIIVDESTGQNSIVVAPGSNYQLSIRDIDLVGQTIAKVDAVLIQLEIPIEVVYHSLKLAKKAGVRTILNPAPAQKLSDELLQYVDIITPNETESELITGIALTDNSSIELAAQALVDKVNEAVVITLGSKGVYYKLKTGESGYVPAIVVTAVDTTAAGDVFNGYFVSALTDGTAFKDALSYANKAAALSVLKKGAQPSIPFKSELN